MARCAGEEPNPPTDPHEFEQWCESGYSGRPVQTHVGDLGTILWVDLDETLCIRFDDGDERLLYREEVAFLDLLER